MADGREKWLLTCEVPPVTEEVDKLLVFCGRSVAEVRRLEPGWWRAAECGSGSVPDRDDYEAAVADARRLAASAERRRLLENALREVLLQREDAEVSRG